MGDSPCFYRRTPVAIIKTAFCPLWSYSGHDHLLLLLRRRRRRGRIATLYNYSSILVFLTLHPYAWQL